MRVSDYTYDLPKERIAQHPPEKRGEARLLVVSKTTGDLQDKHYASLVEYLKAGDVLVLNDTRVIKARLFALDKEGKEVELVLLEKHGRYTDRHRHKALYRGHISTGDSLALGVVRLLVEEVLEGGIAIISSASDIDELAREHGTVPLPPYMKRSATQADEGRYQTVFARKDGSVAAPTASLNMTEPLLDGLRSKGVRVCYLTLHVGLGTFLPIRSDDVDGHVMHSEYFEIPTETVETIRIAKQSGGHVFALGTTVARTLEYVNKALAEAKADIAGEADIFIYPGYKFKLIDGLLTNFHAPKSTVLMLAAAFAGWDKLSAAYQHALLHDYHFLSYGDSMLIV